MKKNEIMSFETIWMDLEVIILSEVSQRQISYDITYMWNLKKKKRYREFPGGLVVKTQHFHCHGLGSIPGWGPEIFQALWHGKKKKKIQLTLFTKQKQTHRHRKQTYGYQRGKRGRDKLGV